MALLGTLGVTDGVPDGGRVIRFTAPANRFRCDAADVPVVVACVLRFKARGYRLDKPDRCMVLHRLRSGDVRAKSDFEIDAIVAHQRAKQGARVAKAVEVAAREDATAIDDLAAKLRELNRRIDQMDDQQWAALAARVRRELWAGGNPWPQDSRRSTAVRSRARTLLAQEPVTETRT
jgi:hypothetical protein